MGVESTKGSWERKVQDKALHELGKEILYEKDPVRRKELERKWHQMKNRERWAQALEKRKEWQTIDYDELSKKSGGLR
jgi:hypothetical protein